MRRLRFFARPLLNQTTSKGKEFFNKHFRFAIDLKRLNFYKILWRLLKNSKIS
ncbi:hypothetical protein CAMGR0001_0170 [Campylobacter gracilis RM3268]|uniref:Uncharacterized protein n=1 Tax=Campylobacter gracilis RM3268 TaxID=553220 RepID=C8PKE9_9BACT|nr:hypothetical protein CAMGR0001_0170 [Campylobacter gracilis RM3268]